MIGHPAPTEGDAATWSGESTSHSVRAHARAHARHTGYTWFVGRIAEKRSIDKMKPLFEQRPAVGSKLGALEPGRFVMLQGGGSVDLDRTPSLLRTEQLPEAELMALAALHRERAPVAAPVAKASSRASRRALQDQA